MADTIGAAYRDAASDTRRQSELRSFTREPLPLGRFALLAGLSWFRRQAGRGQPPG